MKLLLLFLLAVLTANAQDVTRGVGVYPGKQDQYNGAVLVLDTATYRNLALHRPAYASSSYDYNLTAQLVTDGIRETQLPRWFAASSSETAMLPKNRREHLVDGNPASTVTMPGTGGWVQFGVEGRDTPVEVDRIELSAKPWAKELQPQQWTCVLLGSEDGEKWTELGRASGTQILYSANGGLRAEIKPSFVLASVTRSRYYRMRIDASHVESWEVGEVTLFRNNERRMIGGPFSFTSAWKSAGNGEEWVYVDLGAECSFDSVKLYWIERANEMKLQLSNDAKSWKTIETFKAAEGTTDESKPRGETTPQHETPPLPPPVALSSTWQPDTESLCTRPLVCGSAFPPAASTTQRCRAPGCRWPECGWRTSRLASQAPRRCPAWRKQRQIETPLPCPASAAA
jgi:hypothetical protein